jgi:hypothetical protein
MALFLSFSFFFFFLFGKRQKNTLKNKNLADPCPRYGLTRGFSWILFFRGIFFFLIIFRSQKESNIAIPLISRLVEQVKPIQNLKGHCK